MRASSDLSKLGYAIRRRLIRLNYLFQLALRPECEQRDLILSYCVIELDNVILNGLREFLISTLSNARTYSGRRIATNQRFSSEEEMSAYILKVVNTVAYARKSQPARISRRDEPTIRDPRKVADILSDCAATNLDSVERALALNAGIFSQVPTVRNFYAHRNSDTAPKVKRLARDLGVYHAKSADTLISSNAVGRPVKIFEDWVAEARAFFDECFM